MARNSPLTPRVHVVLIPGFGGFDALGQLEYYAAVTPQFRKWQQISGSGNVALHYFDNFPTAAVATRAERLRNYLIKRMARGEFAPGDSLALVGHSTGGLDIRRLLWDMASLPKQSYAVDGAKASASADDLLGMINRVVFLSVPQWGTNIADWVRSYTLGRELVVAELRASVEASQAPVLDKLQAWIAGSASAVTKLELVYAIRDVLSESEAGASQSPMRILLAQEAASELQLWLRYIASDFGAIDDLSAQATDSTSDSPAHFGWEKRDEEEASWREFGIKTRSYATLGARPFRFTAGEPAPRWDLLNPLTYPEVTRREDPAPDTDIVYRAFYRLCAGGPFAYPDAKSVPAPRPFGGGVKLRHPIELWDNDGIVNTASMLWPNGKDTLLVHADHLDFVGHYQLVLAVNQQSGRKYQAYDLLKSGSGFHHPGFQQVWNSVFDFCVS